MNSNSSSLRFGLVALLAAGLSFTARAAYKPEIALTQEYSTTGGLPRFPDFGYMPEPGTYTGRVFVLSQDFPLKQPAVDEGVKKILAIDFKKDWRAYLMAVRQYVFEGNIENRSYENAFFFEDNKVRHWYHVPWQHWGTTGREGYHGLTQEGPVTVQMLAPQQFETTHAYAVGFYNDLGGYTIGQVWADADRPNLGYMTQHSFPVGTVVAKVLFTTFTETQVPYLKNPISWNAYVYASDTSDAAQDAGTSRVTAPVQLIQMDIMVRDPRAASTGGWVFGNFIYNGNTNHENRWENLVPVGIEWGNDPKVNVNLSNPTPTETKINPELTETIINPDKNELPPTHLGWGFRLNGPVDSPQSSCMSCHSTAEYPAISAILPFLENPPVNPPAKQGEPASAEWMRWFRNVPCGVPFDPQAVSFDYSLQLSKSIENFIDYKNATVLGQYAVEYWEAGHKVHRGSFRKPATDPR
jgi:hypothetical protein